MVNLSMRRPALVAFAFALAACGESDDGGEERSPALSPEAVASFEGVYQFETSTENPSGCDGEGLSTLESMSEQRFVLVGSSALGIPFLALASCAGDAECAERAAAIRNQRGYAAELSLLLSTEEGPDELSGLTAWSGYLMDGMCVEREYTAHTAVRTGDVLRVESRTTLLADRAPDDGICWAEPERQKAEAADRPCASLRVFTGRRLGALP